MPQTLSRRGLLQTFAAVGSTLAVPTVLLGAGKATAIRIGALASDVSAEPLYAQAQGLYARGGIEPQIETLSNGGAIIAAVAAGTLGSRFGEFEFVCGAA